jgi:hypothetical protein
LTRAAAEAEFDVLLEALQLLLETLLLVLQFFDRAIGVTELILQALDAKDQSGGVAAVISPGDAPRRVRGLSNSERRRNAKENSREGDADAIRRNNESQNRQPPSAARASVELERAVPNIGFGFGQKFGEA